MRVRPDDMTLLRPEQIPIATFKQQDKKQLLESYFGD
jgi:hypothetical protein